MTLEEYEWLVSDEATRAVAENRGRDPLEVALDTRVPHARLVATQVKYLHRAVSKLPSYAAAQCILPPLALSRRFGQVVTLERNEVLARVARENFRRLGAANIEVAAASAEEYLAQTHERFDWVYADPDRRSATGRKLVRLEDCSPSIPALLPAIRRSSTSTKRCAFSPTAGWRPFRSTANARRWWSTTTARARR